MLDVIREEKFFETLLAAFEVSHSLGGRPRREKNLWQQFFRLGIQLRTAKKIYFIIHCSRAFCVENFQ
jgi:hypothetical protein